MNSYGRDLTTGLRDDPARLGGLARLAGDVYATDSSLRPRPLFADLLRAVGAIEGIERVRFTSPHPKDLRPETIAAMAETPEVCEQLHLPLQSGSDRASRGPCAVYTAARYLERLAAARSAIAGLAVTTDIIVGFPGETEADFEETLEVVAEARYDSAYTFIFPCELGHPRCQSMADEFVPAPRSFPSASPARRRWSIACEVHAHEARLGLVEEVVVEGASRRDKDVVTGRTRQGKLVHFSAPAAPRSRIARNRRGHSSAGAHHLSGTPRARGFAPRSPGASRSRSSPSNPIRPIRFSLHNEAPCGTEENLCAPPRRGARRPSPYTFAMAVFAKVLRAGEGRKVRNLAAVVPLINAFEDEIKALSDEALAHKTVEFRERLASGEELNDLLVEAFAVVREGAWRSIGQRHFDVQLMGGMALHFGWIAEMRTGEGKTLVPTLAAYLNALPGEGVHIVTVNDYLARRDSVWMGRVYTALGLTVGLVTADETTSEAKRAAYGADITYGTNTEFGFDYLRDNMAVNRDALVGPWLQLRNRRRGRLHPHRRGPYAAHHLGAGGRLDSALLPVRQHLADTLVRDHDYEVDEEKRTVVPTEAGIAKVERQLGVENLYDAVAVNYVHQLGKALEAKELYRRDKDYIVADGEVKIVDEFTGRGL